MLGYRIVTEFCVVRGQGRCYLVNYIFPAVIFMLQVPFLCVFIFVIRKDCTLELTKELPCTIDQTLLSSSMVSSGWGGLAPLGTNCSESLIAPLVFNLESFHFS